jgi:cytoskeletal protein RodZ
MSDHEFEKQVQRKMGELKLRPTDAVWTEIEKNIRHTKRRRRFIFWLPVFFLFLATSGYVLYTTSQPSAPIAKSTPAAHSTTSSASTNKIAPNENNTTPSTQSTDSRPATAIAETTLQQEKSTVTRKKQEPVTIPGQPSAQAFTAPDAHETTTAMKRTAGVVDNHRYIAEKSSHKPKRYKSKQAPATTDNLTEYNLTEYNNTDDDHTIEEQSDELAFTMPQTVPQSAGDIATGLAAPDPFTSSVTSLTPEKQNSPAATVPPIQKQKGPKWQWGIQANAGYSRISQSSLLNLQGLFGAPEQNKAENLASRNTPSNAPNYQGGNDPQLNVSQTATKEAAPIQPDFAYSAGVYVQRPLSKRLRLTIGLQYTYMSAHTMLGKLVERTTNVNQGLIGSTFVDQYYTSFDNQLQNGFGANTVSRDSVMVVQKFTYRFHAFEMPVLINWQINKGRRLPPFVLDAGLSLLHLRSIDALHYDGIKDIYYKDNSLFNKTHFNAIMGLNVGLFQDSKLPVWIGPSLRYSLTGLVKKEVSKGQFLWSAGMNVRVGLNRLF